MNKTVSVIVPIYNAENYIKETIDCIINQSYKKIEVLLIDDGSTDNSAIIIDAYTRQDNRIKVFHTPNGGVSKARNFGIEIASGEYIVFWDADDIAHANYIELMVEVLESNKNINVVVSRHTGGNIVTVDSFFHSKVVSSPKTKLITSKDYSYTNGNNHVIAWGAIYDRELISGIRFDEDLKVGEDSVFFANVFKKARKMILIEDKLVYYRHRSDSAVHSTFESYRLDELKAWKRICDLFENESDYFINECYVALAFRIYKIYRKAYKDKYQDNNMYKELIVWAKSLRRNVIRSKNIGYANKLKYIAFSLLPNLVGSL